MFNVFGGHSCSVPTAEKVWVEQRMRWLAGAFGPQRLLGARVVEPTPEFFPDSYDESHEAVEVVFRRVCDYMGVPRDRVRLEFLDDPRDNLGDYTRFEQERIRLNEATFAQPMQLAATCAHELSHVLLLGDERLSEEAADHEPTTDLLMVYLGLGVIAANAAVQYQYGGHAFRHGYMLEREFGYALALFAWLRRETSPAWKSQLRLNVRSVFEERLDFLQGGGDCLLDPAAFAQITGAITQTPVGQLTHDLQSPWPGRRLAALWELRRSPDSCREAASAIVPLLRDNDAEVRRQAAFALALAGPGSAAACAGLLDAVAGNCEPNEKADVSWSIGRLQAPNADCSHTLFQLLDEPDVEVRAAAASALSSYAESLTPTQVDRLCDMCNDDLSLEVREAVLQAFAFLPDAEVLRILPRLLEMLQEPERVLHGEILRVLARLGPQAKAAEPHMVAILRRGDAPGRAVAALALARIAGRPDDAVRALRHTRPLPIRGNKLCRNGYVPGIQMAVEATLRDLGSTAVAGLVDALDGRTLEEVAYAAWGLGQIGPLPREARSRLVGKLGHASPLVRFLSAVAPRRVEGPLDPATPVWLEMLERRPSPGRHPANVDECLGIAAAEILHEIGEPLIPAVFDAVIGARPSPPQALANWLGEFAARHPQVCDRLKHERTAAVGAARERLEIALRRYAIASEAQTRKEQKHISYPPLLDYGEEPQNPIDAAMERFWPWLAEVTPKAE